MKTVNRNIKVVGGGYSHGECLMCDETDGEYDNNSEKTWCYWLKEEKKGVKHVKKVISFIFLFIQLFISIIVIIIMKTYGGRQASRKMIIHK